MEETKQVAKVKCPECSHETNVDVPQNACLPMYKCEGCSEMIKIPADSENCCVVCEYSEDECPYPNVHKEDASEEQ